VPVLLMHKSHKVKSGLLRLQIYQKSLLTESVVWYSGEHLLSFLCAVQPSDAS
jgi:hypothetical protein